MTVKELYEWAIENNAENLQIEVQYRDGGGFYYGCDDLNNPTIEEAENKYNGEKVVCL